MVVQQAKVRVTAELEKAKKEFKEAYDSGEAEKLTAAQEAIADAKIKLDKLANYKPPKTAPLQTPKTDVKQETQSAPAVAPDPKAEAWQRANTWFGQDDEMTSLALGLHQKLVREGVDTRSDDYYQRIDTRMRQLFPDKFEDSNLDDEEDEKPAPKPRQKSNPVAPASRSVAPKKITLTSTQVALAKKLGVPLEEYAKQVALELRKQNG
jgi:hypothetical protein